jgi:hypothetical protein
MSFDINAARKAGYSDQEIEQFLSKNKSINQQPSQNTSFDINGAKAAGYSDEEIQEFLSNQPIPQQSSGFLNKAGRVAGQAGIGAVESLALPYDIYAMGSNYATDLKKAAFEKLNIPYQETLPKVPTSSEIIEKIGNLTGVDTKPKDFVEKSFRMAGLLKNPKSYKELATIGKDVLKNKSIAKDTLKALLPTQTSLVTAPSVVLGLEAAQAGEFGVPGTIAASIASGYLGNKLVGGAKALGKAALNPRESIIKTGLYFTPEKKIQLLKDITTEFRKNGLQADLGTLTNNNFIKNIQTKLAQSSFFGKPLEELIDIQSNQIKEEYAKLTKSLGTFAYETKAEAGNILKDTFTDLRKNIKDKLTDGYENLRTIAKVEKATVDGRTINSLADELIKELSPGAVKSPDTKKVIEILKNLKKNTASDKTSLSALINDKINIGDLTNYEIKSDKTNILRKINEEINDAINSYKGTTGKYGEVRKSLNKQYANFIKTFENKRGLSILNSQNPAELFSQMNTIQGIRDIKRAFSTAPNGLKAFNALAKTKVDDIFLNSLVNSASDQIKFGKFTSIFQQQKNAPILRELLGKDTFNKLVNLSKSSDKLQKSFYKYFNSSKTASTSSDSKKLVSALSTFMLIFTGNPWPFISTTAGYYGIKKFTQAIANPKFLKQVEELILASNTNKPIKDSLIKSIANEIGTVENAKIATKATEQAIK